MIVRISRLGATSLIDRPGSGPSLVRQRNPHRRARRGHRDSARCRGVGSLQRSTTGGARHRRNRAYRSWLHDGCRGSVTDHLPARPDTSFIERGTTTNMELTIQERLKLRSQLRGVGYLCDEFGRVLDEDDTWEPVWQEDRDHTAYRSQAPPTRRPARRRVTSSRRPRNKQASPAMSCPTELIRQARRDLRIEVWHADALCIEYPNVEWFPKSPDAAATEARAICSRCCTCGLNASTTPSAPRTPSPMGSGAARPERTPSPAATGRVTGRRAPKPLMRSVTMELTTNKTYMRCEEPFSEGDETAIVIASVADPDRAVPNSPRLRTPRRRTQRTSVAIHIPRGVTTAGTPVQSSRSNTSIRRSRSSIHDNASRSVKKHGR